MFPYFIEVTKSGECKVSYYPLDESEIDQLEQYHAIGNETSENNIYTESKTSPFRDESDDAIVRVIDEMRAKRLANGY